MQKATKLFNIINYADDTTLISNVNAFSDTKDSNNKNNTITRINNNINQELQKINIWLLHKDSHKRNIFFHKECY